mgnify:CR=1 FL=1
MQTLLTKGTGHKRIQRKNNKNIESRQLGHATELGGGEQLADKNQNIGKMELLRGVKSDELNDHVLYDTK